MNRETALMNEIRTALSAHGCYVERTNVGTYYTVDGRPVFIGIEGQSDLRGHTPDGRAFYIEVKTPTGMPTEKQRMFLIAMRSTGALAGVARSVDDAIKIIEGEV